MRPAIYCIEGQHVTAREIAERTGLAMHSVWNKMQRVSVRDEPVTWAALQASAKGPRGKYKPRRNIGWL